MGGGGGGEVVVDSPLLLMQRIAHTSHILENKDVLFLGSGTVCSSGHDMTYCIVKSQLLIPGTRNLSDGPRWKLSEAI